MRRGTGGGPGEVRFDRGERGRFGKGKEKGLTGGFVFFFKCKTM